MRLGASLSAGLVKLGHDARLMPPAYVKAYVRRRGRRSDLRSRDPAFDAVRSFAFLGEPGCTTESEKCWWRNARKL
jgi:transposase